MAELYPSRGRQGLRVAYFSVGFDLLAAFCLGYSLCFSYSFNEIVDYLDGLIATGFLHLTGELGAEANMVFMFLYN
jgi:hypothetical protein